MKRIISIIILSYMVLFTFLGIFTTKQHSEVVPLQEPPKLIPVITNLEPPPEPIPEYEPEPEPIPEPAPEPEESVEELIDQLPTAYGYILLYDKPYNVETDVKLNSYIGVVYFNGHKETYYSQNVLPGGGLKIPGRHVAEDGTVRDEEGYICVAADWNYLPYGATVLTSLGPARVYDTGCDYGVIDIYVNW